MPKIKGWYQRVLLVSSIQNTIGGIPVKEMRKAHRGEIVGKIWVKESKCWMTRAWTNKGKATFQPEEVTDYDIIIPTNSIPE